jgi:uncharacterized peroxidase-related enzyme
MSFIETVTPQAATGEAREFYRHQQGSLDYLPNYARVFCHRPAVMVAWAALQRELKRHLDTRSYSLVSLAAALASGSSYCALAFGGKLLKRFFTPVELAAVIRGEEDSPLTEGERCMMEVATKVARNAGSVEQDDIHRLREAGYSDEQIFDIVAAAAARCFFSRVPDALGVLPDAPLAEIDESLRELLIVGRPVSDETPQAIASRSGN